MAILGEILQSVFDSYNVILDCRQNRVVIYKRFKSTVSNRPIVYNYSVIASQYLLAYTQKLKIRLYQPLFP